MILTAVFAANGAIESEGCKDPHLRSEKEVTFALVNRSGHMHGWTAFESKRIESMAFQPHLYG